MFFRDGVYLILLVFLCVTSRVSIFFFIFSSFLVVFHLSIYVFTRKMRFRILELHSYGTLYNYLFIYLYRVKTKRQRIIVTVVAQRYVKAVSYNMQTPNCTKHFNSL